MLAADPRGVGARRREPVVARLEVEHERTTPLVTTAGDEVEIIGSAGREPIGVGLATARWGTGDDAYPTAVGPVPLDGKLDVEQQESYSESEGINLYP